MSVEETDDDLIDRLRLGQLRIDEERVPHAVVDVKLGLDAGLHQQFVTAQHELIAKSRLPVMSRVGGNFATTAADSPGCTMGSLKSTPLKYGRSPAEGGWSVNGWPARGAAR